MLHRFRHALYLVACVLALALPAMAQGGSGGESFLSLVFRAGGIFGWVIIACSIIGVALMIEHFISVNRNKVAPPEAVEAIESHLENNDVQAAFEYCEQNPSPLANIMAAALPKHAHGFDVMEMAALTVAEEEATKLNAKISWLSFISSVAPLLGLLGTVSGMLGAFAVIETKASPTPSELAKGIKEALVTTLLGLTVSIPVGLGFFFFKNRVIKLVLETNAIWEDLLDRFRPAAR
jgi:biopolymer transport protein ExbB